MKIRLKSYTVKFLIGLYAFLLGTAAFVGLHSFFVSWGVNEENFIASIVIGISALYVTIAIWKLSKGLVDIGEQPQK